MKWLWSAEHYPKIVAPARERGLKLTRQDAVLVVDYVAPARERGLKYAQGTADDDGVFVAPVRERGLKYNLHAS